MESISGGGGGRTTDATDITSGTFVKERIPPLPTTKIAEGTFDLARIPSIDDARIPDLETLSYGAAFAEGQIPNLPTSKITSGTFDDARIPNIGLNDLEDVNTAGTVNGKVLTFQSGTWLPETPAGGGDMLKSVYDTDGDDIVDNSERLENQTLGSVQDHNVAAAKITSGTIGLDRIPSINDARIPDLETLSYGAAFGTAQIPDLPTVKITSGTFNSDRIPILPTDRYGSAALLTGDQTIGGTKTFGDIPILPASDPTSDNEAARKAYVDAQGGGGIGTHANEYHDPDMLCTNGSNAMAGTLNMGSHPIHAVDELTFTHDAKFYTTTDYEVQLRSKDYAYYASLRMGHLKTVYNINTYGTLDMNGHPLIDVPTPTSGSHAANKTYVDAAKHFWVPVTFGDPASADLTHYGNYPVCHLTLTNYAAYISFNVPDDFHSITEAKVAVIPRNTHAAAAWSVSSHYGAVGESYLQHSGGVATTYSVSNGVLFEVDISGILTSLAAGDYVGIRFHKRDDWAYVDVLGVMFKYT